MLSSTKQRIIRYLAIVILILPLFFLGEFYHHFQAYLTGHVQAIEHEWHIVVLNIVVFVTFLLPLSFRKKATWQGYALPVAFFVSLFIEMYGIPFTLLFVSRYLTGSSAVEVPRSGISFQFLGVSFAMDAAMLYGALLIVIGGALIMLGWVTLYRNIKKMPLVTSGIYAYSRHPQYLGFILIIVGWFIGWPTLITLLFAPILVYKYVRVCLTEEKELASNTDYQSYKQRVPFFL
jgi:protein-S-isoprenylcysteine O-methyltransferase Ste14